MSDKFQWGDETFRSVAATEKAIAAYLCDYLVDGDGGSVEHRGKSYCLEVSVKLINPDTGNPMKYIVWIRERENGALKPWIEQGDGALTEKTANRIAREIRKDFNIPVRVLPVGETPKE